MLAVVTFEFDPTVRVGDLLVRWETLGTAGALLVALLAAGFLVVRASPRSDLLRADDLLFVALGAVPGAVLGARIGYALVHWDWYASRPGDLLDPSQGGLQLTLGVLGGLLTALVVVRLLGLPVGRWMHVAALPILLAIEGGKLAMAWGGTGQGRPEVADLSTAYLGPGPWGSLAPALPSIPSQLLEGLGTGILALGCLAVLAAGGFRSRDGRLLLVAAMAWLVLRTAVASTWRDPVVLAGLNADQVVSLVLLAIAGAVLAPMTRAGGRPAAVVRAGTATSSQTGPDGPCGPERPG